MGYLERNYVGGYKTRMSELRAKGRAKASEKEDKNKIEAIELSGEEVERLQGRIANRELKETDYELILEILKGYLWLIGELSKKGLSIKRLLRFFWKKTEKGESILKGESVPEGETGSECVCKGDIEDSKERGKKRGHGRNGVSSYVGAERVDVYVKELRAGDKCPECEDGKLYEWKEGKILRIKGSPPIQAYSYHIHKLRCTICQKIYKAELPAQAGDKKYDEGSKTIVSVLKYGTGMPFYRLEGFQKNQGVPLPASTQWEMIKELEVCVYPLYYRLLEEGAQGHLFHNDDTTIRILELMEKKGEGNGKEKEREKERKGMFTTGIVSKVNDHEIALYFSGTNHAGENLTGLLKGRLSSLPPPIQMCDALSRNTSREYETLLANCLAHARRNFVDTLNDFPQESEYVIRQLGKVYRNDGIANAYEMSPMQRLEFHQKESGPIMVQLRQWLLEQFEAKKVEPNSSLGKAIKYMNKHWDKLTLFLGVAGAPLDNNAVERILKMAILNRKNSYFYRTLNGAHTGDIFMSIIQTCRLAGVNAVHYLNVLQKYAQYATADTCAWLPWNYRDTLSRENLV